MSSEEMKPVKPINSMALCIATVISIGVWGLIILAIRAMVH